MTYCKDIKAHSTLRWIFHPKCSFYFRCNFCDLLMMQGTCTIFRGYHTAVLYWPVYQARALITALGITMRISTIAKCQRYQPIARLYQPCTSDISWL